MWHLVNCDDPTNIIITNTDLTTYNNQIITIQGNTNCFKVVQPPVAVDVVMTDYFVSCKGCKPKCQLPDCQ